MLSSTEPENVAIGESVKNVLFLRGVLGFTQPTTGATGIPVYEGQSGSVTALTEIPPSSARSRHIDIRYYFIRALSVDGVIRVIYVASRNRHADMLIIPLGAEPLKYHRDGLMSMEDRV